MINFPTVTLEMDLLWYWNRYSAIRPIGLPLGQYISPSIIINKFLKWNLESLSHLESFLAINFSMEGFKGPMIGFQPIIAILCFLRQNHKNIDIMITRNGSKYDKDSKFYFRKLFILKLGDLFWLTACRPTSNLSAVLFVWFVLYLCDSYSVRVIRTLFVWFVFCPCKSYRNRVFRVILVHSHRTPLVYYSCDSY